MGETYAKLFGSITRSSIWLEDDQTLRVWVTLMALADRNGYVGASVAGLASTARVPVETTRKALDKFLAPDPDSRSQEFEGRRIEVADRGWNLLNYERFRDMRDEDARRQIEREKKRRQRATKAAKRAAEDAERPGTFPLCPAPSTTIPPLIGRSDTDLSLPATPQEEKKTMRERRKPEPIPDDFVPDADGLALAQEAGLNAARTAAEFVDHAKANGWERADWQSAFKLWARRAPELAPRAKTGSPFRFVERDAADQHAVNSAIEGVTSGAYGGGAQRKAKALTGPELGAFALQAESAWREQRRAAE